MELWGGVHVAYVLDHRHVPTPSQVHVGYRLTLDGDTWHGKELRERCVLSDETGKLPVGSR